ncbi:Ku protein [Rhodovarius crocodyli]|uniref:Non-homologous end joining protein Ku n=1 Tax=Rhodovarius crocodyli TaxID=1979269 RepID=A0A437MJ46_9PROT|nr:Ku protein [Rhodovarius crocodyli]RVT97680.1 Ku protein [Rhodovarius crocodyli]
MAIRPTWEGHLRLSLVTCPVSLYAAASTSRDVRFHFINPKTGNRVRQQMIDPDSGPIERRDLVRGFEVEEDQYVLLTDEELRSVRLESTRLLDIERFVDAASIDRIWWDQPYYLAPEGKAGADAFAVIHAAMEDAGRIAIARLVMGARERVVAIEPRGKGMLLTTLRSHDEVRDTAEFFDDIPAGKPDKRMTTIARQIVEQFEGEFDPSSFNDRYEEALRELIASKQGGDGGGGRRRKAPKSGNVIDLMEALRQSLEGKAAQRRPAAKKSAKAPAAKKKPAAPRRAS